MPDKPVITVEEVVHEDAWVQAQRIRVDLGQDRKMRYLFVNYEIPHYVMVCPRFDDGQFIMVRQFKPGAGNSIEFIAGGVNSGEPHADAARRELREEVGYNSQKLRRIGAFMNVTDRMNLTCHLYLAHNLIAAPSAHGQHEEVQELEPLFMSEDEIWQAIKQGHIVDMATVLGFYAHLQQG